MKPKCVTSGTSPKRFEIEPLSEGVFDVRINENIKKVTVPRRKRGTVDETEEIKRFQHDLYSAVVRAKDYGSFIAGIVHIKYNSDDEIALINKGIVDAENEEYKAYRAFVTDVKAEAAKYFENK